MATAAERLAVLRAIERSAELQVQLDKSAGLRPMVTILSKAREQAALAMNSLVYADPADVTLIRGYQNEVRRYDDLVAWCQEIINEGIEADRRIDEAERIEFSNLLLSPEVAEEARALGVNEQGHDA
ncbi:hypothetical protein ABIB86_000440 [Bradyrhizobium sp. JR1.7]|uniref:hypothetical protein n=1 Tax=unclassified Bradyrhizobium TaxID=2631580 RepID=UPI00339A058D